MRWLIGLVLLLAAGACAVFVVSRRETLPAVRIEQPDRAVGQTATLVVTAEAPKAQFTALTVTLEQNGQTIPLFSLDSPDQARTATTSPDAPDRLTITRPIGKQSRSRVEIGDGADCRLPPRGRRS